MLGEARACREMAKTGLWMCVGARGGVDWGMVLGAAQILVGGGVGQWRELSGLRLGADKREGSVG